MVELTVRVYKNTTGTYTAALNNDVLFTETRPTAHEAVIALHQRMADYMPDLISQEESRADIDTWLDEEPFDLECECDRDDLFTTV